MSDRSTIRARLLGAHGEAITFAGDPPVRVDFDAAGVGTVAGRADVDATVAATIRAADPTGMHYVVTPLEPPPPSPPVPVKTVTPPKPPARKGS